MKSPFCVAAGPDMNSPTLLDTVNPSVRQSTEPGNSSTPRSDIDAISRQRILADDDLTEYLIEHCYQKLVHVPESEQRYWCDRMHWWIQQRSPNRVRTMEKAMGLA